MTRQAHFNNRLLLLFALAFVLAGSVLRLLQFGDQVLLDDEWHAVHQLLSGKSWSELLTTFGHADYSIPLGLLYTLQADWFGLSEFAMRWPMLLAGLLTLPAFTYWAWTRVSPAAATVFVFLLASSPMLFIYSRTARPYALTLLLSFVALYCFSRWYSQKSIGQSARYGSIAGYVLGAGTSVWLHPITGPLLIAPLLYEGITALLRRDWFALRRLFFMGLATGLFMGVLVLPPLLSDSGALAAKAGAAAFSLQTFVGVWYAWFGTTNAPLTAVFVMLALLGLPTVIKSDPLIRHALLGLALTVLAIFTTEPEWAQYPVTFARYLLPFLPILLLAAAAGLTGLVNVAARQGNATRLAAMMAGGGLLVIYLVMSPLVQLARLPNSQTNHSLYQGALQPGPNPVTVYQHERLHQSTFWDEIAGTEGRGGRLAVAPFYFETYNWGAPEWERRSGQRAIPLMLNGFCTQDRRGEVPENQRFQFKNMYYIEDLVQETSPVSWVVLTKPFVGFQRGNPEALVGGAFYMDCREKLIEQFGQPTFEDEALVAFKRPSGTPRSGTSGN